MTSERDIVEWLRVDAFENGADLLLHAAAQRMKEAASEIERLRAALEKLANPQWGEYRSDEAIVQAVVRIARAALKGEP
jgi:hypothetical protein